jgi:hypothetical protein
MGRKKKVEEAETKRNTPRVSLDNTASKMGQMEKPADLVMLDAPMKKTSMEQITGAKKTDGLAGRTIFNPIQTVAPNAKVSAAKAEATTPTTASTFSDMLAQRRNELRKTAEQDKTDAVKMQKYYALTDALGALGKMGGAAIGGAIGGNIGDSAPIVADYQPSRGYVEAFEKAKQANERLRALDEQDFQLAYAKQQRDEEREYKAKIDALDRKYKKELIDYEAKIKKAIAQDNAELEAKLKADYATMLHEYDIELAKVKGQYNLDEKKLGLTTSKWQAETYNTTPVKLSNGKIVLVPNNYYNSIKDSLVDGKDITDKNVEQYIRANADDILSEWGIITPSSSATPIVATSSIGPVKTTSDTNTETPVVFDANKIAQAEKDALRKDVGIHGIPYMKPGDSSYVGQANDATHTSKPTSKTAGKKVDTKKDSKYSKEDLEFMSQFE